MGYATQRSGGPLVGVVGVPAYIGSGANHTKIEEDGTLAFGGTATTYNDIYMALAPKTTGVGKPTLRTFAGNIQRYTMAVGDVCDLDACELLHGWKEGSAIEIHVHWATRGANDATVRGVKFEVDYSWANMNGTHSGVLSQSAEGSIAAAEGDLTHKYLSVFSFTPTGGKIGSMLQLSLKRIAAVATAPANDPWVFMVGVHYELDTIGSRTVSGK